jgi:hypothetical protein
MIKNIRLETTGGPETSLVTRILYLKDRKQRVNICVGDIPYPQGGYKKKVCYNVICRSENMLK